MAFLTLIAPVIALTYPIDKVSDGKAQAFDLWIKEFVFNALIQPLHLFLYTVLLGAATSLAVINPLYAVVCLGFILAAENLLKKMFGFNKANAGTLGSLAGAAGVSALAHKALMGFGKGPHGGKVPGGKVRTSDNYQRQGRDGRLSDGSAKPKEFDSFNKEAIGLPDAQGEDGGNTQEDIRSKTLQEEEAKRREQEYRQRHTGENGQNSETQGENNGQRETLDDLEQQRAELYNQGYTDDSEEIQDLNERIQNGDFDEPQEEPDPTGSPDPDMTSKYLQGLGADDSEREPNGLFGRNGMFMHDVGNAKSWLGNKEEGIVQKAKNTKNKTIKGFKNIGRFVADSEYRKETAGNIAHKANVAAGKGYKTFKAVAPDVAKKVIRGTAKTAGRVAIGAALGATAGVIGATMGDGEKAISMAGAAFGVGASTGGRAFENSVGKYVKDPNLKETIGAQKYGSKQDYRNAKSDKEFLRSQEFDDYYEKYFQGKKSKNEVKEAFKSYRQAGITDKGTIKKAIALEDKYLKNGGDKDAVRENIQGIIQTKDLVDSRSFRDDKFKQAEISRIERQLTNVSDKKERRKRAETLFRGYRDFYELG